MGIKNLEQNKISYFKNVGKVAVIKIVCVQYDY